MENGWNKYSSMSNVLLPIRKFRNLLIDDDNLRLFFPHFSLVEWEIGSVTNNEGASGCMIGESVNFKILLAFSSLATITETV